MYEVIITRPRSLAEAIEALGGDNATALAGGQTLIPTMKQRLAAPEVLVSLAGIEELSGVTIGDGEITIAAATTHAEVAREVAGACPALAALAGGIGDPAVRNRGTIGGSLANNDPAADYPAAVLACDATIITNDREIRSDEFFDGLFSTALLEGEIITAVRFPMPERAAYAKFDQPASRFALTGVFVAAGGGVVRVAVTGAGEDGVFRWDAAEQALMKDFSPSAIEGLSPDPSGMIGDLHGTPEYRAHLVGVMTKRAVEAALG